MRDVLDELVHWWRAGQPVGMATVVSTRGSAPRAPGATMLVGPDRTVVGSVSGGCVEGAVYELAVEVVASGRPIRQRYAVADDDAFAVGLTCGGVLDVFVERIDQQRFPELGEVADAVTAGVPVAIASCVAGGLPVPRMTSTGDDHPDPLGRRVIVWPDRHSATMGSAELDAVVTDGARGLLADGRTGILSGSPGGQRQPAGLEVFVNSLSPPPRMIIFGAIDFAVATSRVGALLGYRVTVCDARPVFATRNRFPDADQVVVSWPHTYLSAEAEAGRVDGRTVVCVLTHDPKFDVPVLEVALRLPVAYVGAMGSRRTHDDRMTQLRRAGLEPAELSRLCSPIGLDLGAHTPEETAISVAAEIVARRWGGSGERLTKLAGSIHRRPSPASFAP
jgi:xanthine dehydrogenase accessory factor